MIGTQDDYDLNSGSYYLDPYASANWAIPLYPLHNKTAITIKLFDLIYCHNRTAPSPHWLSQSMKT